MNIWYYSDSHFGHANILKFCNRPFSTIEEHDQALIVKWNSVVKPEDTVYHLGDFMMGKGGPEQILSRLNGEKHLIYGNHDPDKVKNCYLWASSQPYLELKLGKDHLILCHYKFAVFNRCHHGAMNLFGHSHGNMVQNAQQIDVGVDCWDYTPVSLEQIKKKAETLPPFYSGDHHHKHRG